MISEKVFRLIRENKWFRVLVWQNFLRYRKSTGFLRILPSFAVIGVPRGGTTTVFHSLVKHPNIASPLTKELKYLQSHNQPVLADYRQYFPFGFNRFFYPQNKMISGDGNPKLMYVPSLAGNLSQCLPELKIVIMLRNPISRAYSMHSLRVKSGKETLSFEDAIKRERDLLPTSPPLSWVQSIDDFKLLLKYGYLTMSLYSEFLKPWLDAFPRENFLFVDVKQYYANPVETYRKIIAFLDLPQWSPAEIRASNSATKGSMNPHLKQELQEKFLSYNQALYQLIGIDYGWDAD